MDASKELIFGFPLPSDNVGISCTSLSIFKELYKQKYPVTFITPRCRSMGNAEGIVQVLPVPLRALPWKYVKKIAIEKYKEKILDRCKDGAIVDLWSTNPISLYEALRKRRVTVIKEKFNCSQEIARKILSYEFNRLKAMPGFQINDKSVAQEIGELRLSDFIMSPSPMVHESLLSIGIEKSKIIDTSFGWEPVVSERESKLTSVYKKPRFLFVGSVCIRKGAHLLIDYWKKAQIDGTLIFLGQIQKDMEQFVNDVSDRKDIVFLGHHEKEYGIYKSCDVFCFPSLEEGGPLVTYEALARGMASIVTPMGAGAVIRNETEGIVLDPYDEHGWVNAMKSLAHDHELREKYSRTGLIRLKEFTWEKVAVQRYSEIMKRVL